MDECDEWIQCVCSNGIKEFDTPAEQDGTSRQQDLEGRNVVKKEEGFVMKRLVNLCSNMIMDGTFDSVNV